MDPNKHLYIAYSANAYDSVNCSYYPMSQELLDAIKQDKRVSDSLIFDMNRQTIYAQGKEFGGLNAVFPITKTGTAQSNNYASNVITNNTYFISGITQDQYGRISYTYSFAYLNLEVWHGAEISFSPTYITSLYVNQEGKLTYRYANVMHLNMPSLFTHQLISGRNENHNDFYNKTAGYKIVSIEGAEGIKGLEPRYGTYVMTGAYITPEGILQTAYYDASVTSGQFKESYTLNDSKPLNVITGITQSTYGQISYTYTKLNTTHSTLPGTYIVSGSVGLTGTKIVTNVYLNNNGELSYTYERLRINTAEEALTITYLNAKEVSPINSYSVIWIYRDPENSNQLTFSYSDLSTSSGTKVTPTTSSAPKATLLNSTSYRVLTNIKQHGDGKISYTYSDINTSHSTLGKLFAPSDVDVSDLHTRFVITNVSLSKDGHLAYSYANLSTQNSDHSGPIEEIVCNDSQIKVISNITQSSNGKISYSLATLSTKLGHEGDNVSGPMYNLTVDKYGKISYTHKNLSSSAYTGVSQGDKKLQNGPTAYQLLTGISQDADGKISYSYISLATSFSNYPTGYGILKNVHIDDTGRLSYKYESIEVNKGVYKNSLTFDKGVKVVHETSPSSYTLVLNGIYQNEYGQISYTYTALYTDPKNDYKWHEIKVTSNSLPSIPIGNTVDVVNKIKTEDGNAESHDISFDLVTVPTKVYVDNLLNATDALHYVGVITPADTANGDVKILSLGNYSATNPLISYTGAVYKVSGQGYFGNEYVTSGDMIISHDDNNQIITSANPPIIRIFTGWDVINNNLNLETIYNGNTSKSGSKVVTAAKLTDHGTFSYASYSLSASTKGTRIVISESNANDIASSDSWSTNILRTHINQPSTVHGFKVITNVRLTQSEYDTELSYTYGFIYVDKNHHETIANTQPMKSSYVLGAVSLSSDGRLSYSYIDIAKSAYHYSVQQITGKYADNLNVNTYTRRGITNILRDINGHVTAYSYTDFSDTHLYLKKIDKAAEYWMSGFYYQNATSVNSSYMTGYISSNMPSLVRYSNNTEKMSINAIGTIIKSNSLEFKDQDVVNSLPATHTMSFLNLKSLWGTI